MSQLGAILDTLRQIIVDPTSNLTAAVLLLASVVLLALIIVIALLLWVTTPAKGSRKRPARTVVRDESEYEYPELSAELAPELPGETAAAEAERRPAGPLSRWLAGAGGSAVIWGLVAVAAIAGYAGTTGDAFCAESCHAGGGSVKTRTADPHKAVRCTSCHEDGGLTGIAGSAVLRVAHVAQRVVPGLNAYAGGVPARRCTSCHGEVLAGTITVKDLGVRVAHRQPLDGGMTCDDCHAKAGHGGTIVREAMTKCVRCHDGKRASAECRTCHTKDTSLAVRASGDGAQGRLFSKVRLSRVSDCGGCHSQTSCDNCHGIRMPHSERFLKWEHARYAGFAKKQVCWRCHVESLDCGRCHEAFSRNQHGIDFVVKHRANPRTSTCACHWTLMPPEGRVEAGSFCAVCH